MEIKFFSQDYEGASAGTRLFFQSGMWFYKTRTEMEKWLTVEFVEGNPELFCSSIKSTVFELFYKTKVV